MWNLIYKRADTWPPFQATINLNKSGNLAGATVVLYVKDQAESMALTFFPTILDGAAGTVEYQWLAGQLDLEAGTYWMEVQVTAADGNVARLPHDGYINLIIMDRIS